MIHKLFELRACWEEYYDCPDNGQTKICDAHETIAFSVDDTAALQQIATELEEGYKSQYWSEERSKRLRSLYPGYDDHRDTTYRILDVSDLILNPESSNRRPDT